jgi:hypothetical protein
MPRSSGGHSPSPGVLCPNECSEKRMVPRETKRPTGGGSVGRSAEEVLGEDRRYRSRAPGNGPARSRPGEKRGPSASTRKRIANGDLCQENTRSGGKSPGRRPSTLVPGPLPGVSQGRNGRTSRTDPKERTQDPCQGGVRLPFSAYYAYYAPSTAYYAPLRCVKRTPRGRSWGSFVSGRPRNPRTHARFRSTDPKTAFPTSRLHRGQHATRLSGVSHPPFFRGTT